MVGGESACRRTSASGCRCAPLERRQFAMNLCAATYAKVEVVPKQSNKLERAQVLPQTTQMEQLALRSHTRKRDADAEALQDAACNPQPVVPTFLDATIWNPAHGVDDHRGNCDCTYHID